jgi:hypothetical protein
MYMHVWSLWFLTTLCWTDVAALNAFAADSAKPIGVVQDLAPIPDADLQPYVDLNNGTVSGVSAARKLIQKLFTVANEPIPSGTGSCIIHVVKWARDPVAAGKPIIAKSNWYVYNPADTWTDVDFATNKRLFGVKRPYLLVIHLNGSSVAALGEDYKLAYTYTAVHRLPANIEHLKDVIDLFKPSGPEKLALVEGPVNYWALGTIEGDPPADITITAAISNKGTNIPFDSVTPKFDNEGYYRWDVSIGVPILAYKQLEDVVSNAGQTTLANIGKRNVLVLGDWFFKPVDIKSDTFLAVPHLVGGVAVASKPLHSAMVGLGWGPAVANFYVGVMILTNNLPNHQLDHHYKLAFGLNVPLRQVASKLGLKSQIQ